MSSTTYIAFVSSDKLFSTTDGFITRMNEDGARPEPQTVEAIMTDFLNEALEVYFVQPQDFLGLSSGMKRVVNMTVDTISKAATMVVKRAAKKMDLEQNREAARYMDTMRLCVTDDGGAERWYVAFPLDEGVRGKAEAAIAEIRKGHTESGRNQLTDYLLELADVGLYWYFEEPMKLLGFGPVMRRAADMGVETTRKATKSTISRIFPKLDEKQLGAAADYIESLMLTT